MHRTRILRRMTIKKFYRTIPSRGNAGDLARTREGGFPSILLSFLLFGSVFMRRTPTARPPIVKACVRGGEDAILYWSMRERRPTPLRVRRWGSVRLHPPVRHLLGRGRTWRAFHIRMPTMAGKRSGKSTISRDTWTSAFLRSPHHLRTDTRWYGGTVGRYLQGK